MRIAIVADPYVPVPPKKYGGTEQVIYYSIKGLQELGHEPVLFAAGDSEVGCELVPTTKKHLFFPLTKAEVPAHRAKVTRIARRTEEKLLSMLDEFDVVHWHANLDSPFNMQKFVNFPNITTLHGPVRFHDLDFLTSHSDLNFVTVSKNQQDAFPGLRYAGVVYNGEDPSEFPIVTDPDDYVCFIGRFDREKNPHLAILLAISYGIKIKVAGKIDHLAAGYFKEEVEPFLNHPLVEYLGELGFEEKVELMSKAKCNLHPTGFREPFGLTVIEAAYCGTPTLAIRRGAMPELIEEGRTGLLVEDFIEGYSELQQCFEMDRNYIATRARSLFNYRTMAEGYVKAYETAIEWHKQSEKEKQFYKSLPPEARRRLKDVRVIESFNTYTGFALRSRGRHIIQRIPRLPRLNKKPLQKLRKK